MTVVLLVGARPNFIKAAPLWRAFQQQPRLRALLLHTGQHWQPEMSQVFVDELGLPRPLVCSHGALREGVPAGLRALAKGIREQLRAVRPHWLVVIGDVTTAAAGALAARQLGIPLAHVEAGLRCGDLHMAEERNRILVDHLAQLLFVTEPAGVENLLREGIPEARIRWVGNVLIDALFQVLPIASQKCWTDVVHRCAWPGQPLLDPSARAEGYALCTLHRAENVDNPLVLKHLVDLLIDISCQIPTVFPVHPRTEHRLLQSGLWEPLLSAPHIALLRPVRYSDMICLQKNARLVLTDSGGVQEETTVLGVPCLTLRPNTERPITLQCGTNALVNTWSTEDVMAWIRRCRVVSFPSPPPIPPLWDGRAAERIAQHLLAAFETTLQASLGTA